MSHYQKLTRKDYNEIRTLFRRNRSNAWERFLFDLQCDARKRRGMTARVHGSINWRAELWDEITAPSRDGRVGYIVAGRDCDQTQYRYEGVMDLPAGAFLHMKAVEHHEAYLDGPESTCYVDPEGFEPQRYRSRDLALEAFEDGHPGYVVPGELEVI